MARKSTTDSVAQDQIRAFVERIMRMREEAKAINDDIREIYAEAKAVGFDKTVLGQIVSYLEKRSKDPDTLAERSALFDLYLGAIDGARGGAEDEDETGTVDATHMHEADKPVEVREPSNKIEAALRTSERRKKIAEAASAAKVEISTPVTHAAGHAAEGLSLSPQHGSSADQIEPSGNSGELEPVQEMHELPVQPSESPALKTEAEASAGSTAALFEVRDNSTEGSPAPEALNPVAATTPPAGETPPVDTIYEPGSIRHESTPPVGIVRHDYQRCFPEQWGPALGDLKDDIRANGVKEPILMQGNVLLDGWARYMAARGLGVDYPVKEYDGDDPLADIIKLNMAARKLNLAERVSIARKLIKAAPEREADIGELLDLEQVREAAE